MPRQARARAQRRGAIKSRASADKARRQDAARCRAALLICRRCLFCRRRLPSALPRYYFDIFFRHFIRRSIILHARCRPAHFISPINQSCHAAPGQRYAAADDSFCSFHEPSHCRFRWSRLLPLRHFTHSDILPLQPVLLARDISVFSPLVFAPFLPVAFHAGWRFR